MVQVTVLYSNHETYSEQVLLSMPTNGKEKSTFQAWVEIKTWGGFHTTVYALHFKFALCDHPFCTNLL
jgi:hypothetical protein